MRIQSEMAMKRCQEQLKTWYAAKSPDRLPSTTEKCTKRSARRAKNTATQ